MAKRESRFGRLARAIAAEYRRKGYSPARAAEIGRATAATIGFRKYGKRRMEAKAQAARRRRRIRRRVRRERRGHHG
jgi:hypothetical protein